ncbi:hypothetical protein AALA82_09975 [Oscillospiraceae bacterium 50-16]
MLYDRRDFGLLRLAGAYQWLPLAPLRALSPLKQLSREADLLSLMGLLTFSRNKEYLMPSPRGYQFLNSAGLNYQPPTKRPYSNSPKLSCRLEIGSILFASLSAGIEPALDKVEHLKRQPVVLPAFTLRSEDGNLMNAAGCSGFGHWGNTAYMIQYVSEYSTGFL